MKNKKRIFSILGLIFFVAGFAMFILGTVDLEFGFSKSFAVFLTVMGVVFLIGAIILIVLDINFMVKSSKELTVNENDERNVMIRGKAAEKTFYITVFMMLALEFVLIILKEQLASLLVSIVMLVACFLNVIFISIYQKKL